jgi:transposase
VLTLPAAVRIFVALEPTDMRKQFDGLYAAAREVTQADPFSGHLFVFSNRRRDLIRILMWDRSGFALWSKRLERGTFPWPTGGDGRSVEVRTRELMGILEGLDLSRARWRRRFDRLPFAHAD